MAGGRTEPWAGHIVKRALQRSSQHFQVALQSLEFTPRNLRRMLQTGWATYRADASRAGMPLFMHVEPTAACNLRCTMCPREEMTRAKGHMDIETFRRAVDEVDPIELALVGFGEPLLHPRILDMVAYSVGKGVTTRISSNGTRLTPEMSRAIVASGLHHMWFSIDSPSKERYEAIRVGADFDATITAVKQFIAVRDAERSTLVVSVNYTITRENFGEVPAMVRFCHEELGAPPVFARSYGYDLEGKQALTLRLEPAIEEALLDGVRAAEEHGLPAVAHNLETIVADLRDPLDGKGPCYFPYYAVAVSWDGMISPCCLYYDYQIGLGNLADGPFEDVWNGCGFQRLRERLAADRPSIHICDTCPLSDVSLHEIMARFQRIPGTRSLSRRRYGHIDRG